MLAKFKDSSIVEKQLSKHIQDKTAFIFNITDSLFEREVSDKTNFISIYYLEYDQNDEDIQEIANLLLKREKLKCLDLGLW